MIGFREQGYRAMRIATFNVQNLRLRRAHPPYFDGARDDDTPDAAGPDAERLDHIDRMLTARLIAQAQADAIALQEVFDQKTLDSFHDSYLAPLGAIYPFRICLEGNDGRSKDVALLSRRPLDSVESHAAMTFADIGVSPPSGVSPSSRVFRRDCLTARCGRVWLFVCHFKVSALSDPGSHIIRRAEALAVRKIIERRFSKPEAGLWLAMGDFNAHNGADEEDLVALTHEFALDLTARIPERERWTFYEPESRAYSCPDRIVVSHGLLASCSIPHISRTGLARRATSYSGYRFDEVGEQRPHASDHALMMINVSL